MLHAYMNVIGIAEENNSLYTKGSPYWAVQSEGTTYNFEVKD